MKKVITQEVLEAQQRMQELIEDNSEKRRLVSELSHVDDEITATVLVKHPEFTNRVVARAAATLGTDPRNTAVVFKKAKLIAITTEKGITLPQYDFSYVIEYLGDAKVLVKIALDFTVDTSNGLVIKACKIVRDSRDTKLQLNSDASALPASLGEKSLGEAFAKFMLSFFTIPVPVSSATKTVKEVTETVKTSTESKSGKKNKK